MLNSVIRLGAALAVIAGTVSVATAQGEVVQRFDRALPAGDRIDWSRGLIVAVGAGVGDARSPSPSVARVTAERDARTRAQQRLRDRGRTLPLAAGGTVGQRLEQDANAARRYDSAVHRAIVLDTDYTSDGSVVVRLGLPLEAVRLAVVGAPVVTAPLPASSPSPTALIVDARKQLSAPVLGLRIGDYSGPVVYYRSMKAATADARLGPRSSQTTAVGVEGGALLVDSAWSAQQEQPLVVVVLGRRRGAR